MGNQREFTSLSEVAAERARLNELRKVHAQRLERHWEAMKDHEVRGLLLRDAVGDMVRSWKPASMIAGLMGGGSLTSAVGAAVFRGGGLTKRMLSFAVRLLVPYLLKQAGNLSVDRIMTEVQSTMERVKKRMAERRDRTEQEN
ncbi:MAG: hypothetical protein IPG74_09145 [Flavobacteriales bacterium]|nr:hypothetical protein [Flavobacteriales bacterium]